jgi:glutamyl-tRNA synthetase
MSSIRTRFAPSPTGNVHIGNLRAAIYNWLFARRQGGQFLLRLEDTDRERSTPEAVKTVFEALDWLGLEADEEPVYQSQRREAHLAAAETLLSKGLAYKEDKGNTGRGEAVVFRMPDRDMAFDDAVKGTLKKKAKDMQDLVIVRSDGSPVFHLANVVDDAFMGVTHVIRGDDHAENTFRHIALYEALELPVPQFGHLPMIVNAQGKPYSKRDGAAFVGEFREQGYLAEALFNYLVLLGWSPGDDREVMERADIVEAFGLDRVQASPARFDWKKFEWMNGEHVRRLPLDEHRRQYFQAIPGSDADPAYLDAVIEVMQERIKKWPDIAPMAGFFFTDNYAYDADAMAKRFGREGAWEDLAALRAAFEALPDFSAESTEAALRALAEERGLKPADLIHPVRLAVSGIPQGPSLFHMLAVLGRDRVLKRMRRTAEIGR